MKKLLFLALLVASSIQAAEFKAGVACVKITPPMPFWLTGYSSRTNAATTVHADLWAKALAFTDDKRGRAVIVTTDLIGLPREVSDVVAERVRKQHGIQRSQLFLTCSHTHYGPVIWPNLQVMFDLDAAEKERCLQYNRTLIDNLVKVVGDALADLSPAKVSSGHGTADFAMNRRLRKAGTVNFGEDRTAPTDHDVPVIRVTSPEGKLRVVLYGYACHNTTLNAKFNEVDGDFAGLSQRLVEEANPGATAMFMILCGADQNPSPRGEYFNVEEHGKELAAAVNRVLAGEMKPVRPPIKTTYQGTQLDFAPHSKKTFEDEVKDTGSLSKFKRRRSNLMLTTYAKGTPIRRLPYQVQALRLSEDLTLLALSGEVVVDYALRAKREYPSENLIVAGYCYEVSCYIPSTRVLREGGYEPVTSMIYYGQPGPLADTVEEKIFSIIHDLMARIGVKKRTDKESR